MTVWTIAAAIAAVHTCILPTCDAFIVKRRTAKPWRRGSPVLPAAQQELEGPVKVFFDIEVDDDPIGRLVFELPDPTMLPEHTQNLMKLCTGERRPIDPLCSYQDCAFEFSPQYVEGFPQYRWAHVLKGRGRNAVGRPTEKIAEPANLRSLSHSIYGGTYYGLKYDELLEGGGVMLTIPLGGPGRGSTRMSIVRVGESPQEWKERLLLNSAVVGRLESGIETLHLMARQTSAPPKVIATGVLGA